MVFGKVPLASVHGQVLCFSAHGHERFHLEPRDLVRLGGHQYTARWQLHQVVVSESARATSLWVVRVQTVFPSFVEHVGPSGERLAHDWNKGYSEHVSIGVVDGRSSVFVGATNNDERGASLAILDADRVSGGPPGLDEAHQCNSCGAGGPRVFRMFPVRDADGGA